MHASEPVVDLYLPEMHAVQESKLPVKPTLQEHCVDPVVVVHELLGQAEQLCCVPDVDWYWPIGHPAHVPEPEKI